MGADEVLTKAVDAALDAALGPVPGGLVEERPELDVPEDLDEALRHRYYAPGLLHGMA